MGKLLTFEELTEKHLALLSVWLLNDHVRQFWNDLSIVQISDLNELRQKFLQREDCRNWIASLDQVAFAYIQSYEVTKKHLYARYIEGKTVGIDLFIGDERYLNKQLSVPLIKAFIENYCSDVERIIIDPQADNHRAISVYQRVGFIPVDTFTPEKDDNFPEDMQGIKHLLLKLDT